MNKLKHYGLIGYPLTHSFSPQYFADKFVRENIQNVDYQLYPLENIALLPDLLQAKQILGLNVTIPYKQQILPFLHEMDEVSKQLQAVNCIAIKDNKLLGFNTDVVGFEKSLKPLLNPHHQQALILGKGGAAQAVAHVLNNLGIDYQFVTRKPETKDISYEQASLQLKYVQLLINTTPIGTFPRIDEMPNLDLSYITEQHLVYDLIYNPSKTLLLQQTESKGASIKNGYEMLCIQAEESWKIWQNIK